MDFCPHLTISLGFLDPYFRFGLLEQFMKLRKIHMFTGLSFIIINLAHQQPS